MGQRGFDTGYKDGKRDMEALAMSFDWMNLEDEECFGHIQGYLQGARTTCDRFLKHLKKDGVVSGDS